MILDFHAHLVGSTADARQTRFNLWNRVLKHMMGVDSVAAFREKIVTDLNSGPVGKAVLCAIENTPLAAGNQEVLAFCRSHPGFLYGVNLNPLSPTIEEETREAVRAGAVLVKLLPSFQKVDPADERCGPFWELMRAYNLPVLVHTGPEHTLAGGPGRFNDPARLETAAQMGVTLVCAHCGCQMMLQERHDLGSWIRLVRRYPNVYGDASGFCGCVRHFWLRRILRDPALASRLVFGTDYPSYPHFFRKNAVNIFAAWVSFFRQAGLSDDFFKRGEHLIRQEEKQ